MLFKRELAIKIAAGQKTQTRRLVKPGERMWVADIPPGGDECVLDANGRIKWQVGRDYAVQVKRGSGGVWANSSGERLEESIEYRPVFNGYHSEMDYHDLQRVDRRPFLSEHGFHPLRIRITRIRQEADVRAISEADAQAEGFSSVGMFLLTWAQLNDTDAYRQLMRAPFVAENDGKHVGELRHELLTWLATRPAHLYGAVWVLDFDVVPR